MAQGYALITGLKLFRNVGQFDSVTAAADIALAPMTLIYAENGRGKTTLAAVLRSLSTGNPVPIAERRRLSAQNPPQVVLDCIGGPPPAVFENNAWNRTVPQIVIFDDTFVDENVCSGLAVDPDHRQNLHELILGAQGVALNTALQTAIANVEEQNRLLRLKEQAISVEVRGTLSIDNFCVLPNRDDIDIAIREAERALAAAKEAQNVQRNTGFDVISLPEIPVGMLRALLARSLPEVEAQALAKVQAHLAKIGDDGEAWVESGMARIFDIDGDEHCPFCAQALADSDVISHYRAYFSAAYSELKNALANALAALLRDNDGDAQAAFERGIRIASEKRQFWSRFAEIPEINVDTAAISRDWSAARRALEALLSAKQSAPLDPLNLSADAMAKIGAFDEHRRTINQLNAALQQSNARVAVAKERAAGGNEVTLAADVSRLKASKTRHTPALSAACAAYSNAKAAKAQAEQDRDAARDALDRHREAAFPAYQIAINVYLQRFNAGFRLDQVVSTNIRGGSSCTYNLVINNHAVPVGGAAPNPGTPSFRNALSAGDRNTLALAFFFASLDQDQSRANRIVVIDDPITSLDEHRVANTVNEMRRLANQVQQVIVLSHNRPFLCDAWEQMDTNRRAALEVVRDPAGSTIRAWDVNRDCITEHDRRHKLIREYISHNSGDKRDVAESLRPTIEAFIRVAYPESFPPGTLLGPFYGLCAQRVGTGTEILDQGDIDELRALKDYSNRYHHDTNPAYRTANINDAELLDFARRTLSFAKR